MWLSSTLNVIHIKNVIRKQNALSEGGILGKNAEQAVRVVILPSPVMLWYCTNYVWK